jgi:Tat protein secretion system quality control protein TatD with DNase activity
VKKYDDAKLFHWDKNSIRQECIQRGQRIAQLEGALKKETARANSWVSEVSELSTRLGLHPLDSKGSTQEWSLIKRFALNWKEHRANKALGGGDE